DLLDADRQQLALAQQAAHVTGGVALDHTLARAAERIERRVFKGAHWDQSSRVTRRTSSTVVSPLSTRVSPSSRIDGVNWRAYRSISCSPAPSWIIVRSVSSMTMSS